MIGWLRIPGGVSRKVEVFAIITLYYSGYTCNLILFVTPIGSNRAAPKDKKNFRCQKQTEVLLFYIRAFVLPRSFSPPPCRPRTLALSSSTRQASLSQKLPSKSSSMPFRMYPKSLSFVQSSIHPLASPHCFKRSALRSSVYA